MKLAKPVWNTGARSWLRYGAIALLSCLLLVHAQPALTRLAPAASTQLNQLNLTATPSALGRSLPSPVAGSGARDGDVALASSSASDNLALGKQHYEAGRLSDAAQAWQQAAEQFAQQPQPTAQATALRYRAIALQDLGQWDDAAWAIAQALALVQAHPDPFLYAQLLTTQGSLQLHRGQAELAYATYQQAEAGYRSLGDRPGVLLSQVNQVQALQALGFYRRAQTQLLDLQQRLGLPLDLRSPPSPATPSPTAPSSTAPSLSVPDTHTEITEQQLQAQTLRSLGQILHGAGELAQAQAALDRSLGLFEQLNASAELAPTLILLGELREDQQAFAPALALYQQAGEQSQDPRQRLDADLHRLRLLIRWAEQDAPDLALGAKRAGRDRPKLAQAVGLSQQLLAQLQPAQTGRWGLYAQVNLAESLRLLGQPDVGLPLLDQARHQAQRLGDARAESYALGQQGRLYEAMGNWPLALALTRQAKQRSMALQADEITVQWLWQEGRILKAQGDSEAAIAPYSEAVTLLQSLRQDLAAMNPEVQFSFRDQVEPVYRQLVSVLLEGVDQLPALLKQDRLERSRQALEALQLAQVQNFLREACEVYAAKPIEQIDASAAVFYPIVLADRLEVILSLPGQPLQHYGSALPDGEQQRLFRQLRQALNPAFPAASGLPAAQELYDRLIRPSQALLEQQPINTLVFVLDDFLRSLPMAVLHDGDRYLVERYALALTPGLQLFDAQPLVRRPLQILAGGLTQARQGFAPLPGVARELNQLSQPVDAQTQAPDPSQPPHRVQLLLDQDFTRTQLTDRAAARPASILHLATHGQFSSNAEDTFLLTWDDRITIQELDRWLSPTLQTSGRSPASRAQIELLVLSACQTAKGDRRATLGLAGVAVRSGARSTLATLWSVQDQSTADFTATFYQQLLGAGQSRAEAVRQAQLSLLRGTYSHPYYWAPFVLVGNWQ